MHNLVRFGNLLLVSILLLNGCSKEKALFKAVQDQNTNRVYSLIRKGVNVNVRTKDGTPLTVACKEGNLAIFSALLDAGADINLRNKFGETPLIVASLYGYPELVDILLKANANVDAKDNLDKTALYLASWRGNIETVRLLLQAGANVNKKAFLDREPLLIALQENHLEVAKILLNSGANPNISKVHILQASMEEDLCLPPTTPLSTAISTGNAALVRLLLDSGADTTVVPNQFVYNAVESGNTEILRLLIDAKADVNMPGGLVLKRHPLAKAVLDDNVEMVRILLDAGAQPNVLVESFGGPILNVAIIFGNIEIVKLLLDAGANPFFGEKGERPIDNIPPNGEIATLIQNALQKEL